MATSKLVLKPYNNITLAAGTQYNLVSPDPGHYVINILNAGTTEVYISNANTVGSADPGSYGLPANLSYSARVYGPSGIWAAGAGAISVALIPNQGGG